jgi:hypothetical protein
MAGQPEEPLALTALRDILDVHFVSPAPVPFPWERRAPARLQKPCWSVVLPGKTLELAMNL